MAFKFSQIILIIVSDILERNNDYSDTLDFRNGWEGMVGDGHVFRFAGPWLQIRNINMWPRGRKELTFKIAFLGIDGLK